MDPSQGSSAPADRPLPQSPRRTSSVYADEAGEATWVYPENIPRESSSTSRPSSARSSLSRTSDGRLRRPYNHFQGEQHTQIPPVPPLPDIPPTPRLATVQPSNLRTVLSAQGEEEHAQMNGHPAEAFPAFDESFPHRDPSVDTPPASVHLPNGERYFRSRRIQRGTIERPWMNKKDPREKWVTILPLMGLFVGLVASGIMAWASLRDIRKHHYCPVLFDDFASLNDDVWTKEVETGGYQHGTFDMTTQENVYVENRNLVIRPTLQNRDFVDTDYYMDLRDVGCTGTTWQECTVATNTTNGTIVNPVLSGRINTKLGASIKFGRVEVTAKLPEGDWLWPSITMLPVDNKYGRWPLSGQIDIMQSRGNNYHYKQGGNNIISSTLHFGPNRYNDGWWRNNVKRENLHKPFSAGWHTFGVEWSEKYVFTYIDTRLLHVMYTHFDEFFWTYGRFPLGDSNGTRFMDPWSYTGDKATPFDQNFYLVINLAVGGTNGWFEDGRSDKPWLDNSPTARRDFWQARDSWWPTWQKQGELRVKSVKIWQQGGHNGCRGR